MTDIADLLQAGQDAIFTALKPLEDTPGLPDGLGVFQHLPENTKPPYVMVGAMRSESDDEQGDQFEKITVEVQYVYLGPGRAPLLAMIHAGRKLLDRQDLPEQPGAQFERPRWLKTEASDTLDDGLTYVGLSNFEFYAEPA